MSNPINTTEALAALHQAKSILSFYRIGKEDEAKEIPQAIWMNQDELHAFKHLIDLAEAFSMGFVFVAISGWGWGKSKNPIQAFANCKKESPRGSHHSDRSNIKLYLAHPDTQVHPDGSWSYPQGFEPVQINKK